MLKQKFKLKNNQIATALICGALIVLPASSALAKDDFSFKGPFQKDEISDSRDMRSKKTGWIYEGVSTLKLDRNIKHYKWLMKVGDGPYDWIRVHRYVKESRNHRAQPLKSAPNRQKVLFAINGTWAQEGPEPIEFFDSYYFPKNGYDMWTMDFRTSFVPNLAYDQFEEEGEQDGLLTTADWTYSVFREDLKKAVDFAKKTAKTKKVFMTGRSRGGRQLFMYSAKYQSDIKGMIALDGGPIYQAEDNLEQQKPESAYQAALTAMKSDENPDPILQEVGNYELGKLLKILPYTRNQVGAPLPDEAELPFGAPPDGSSIARLSDLHAYYAYFAWGEGKVTNVYTPYPGGTGETYMDKAVLAKGLPLNSRYWPAVQTLEESFLAGYADNPYLDYDDTQDVKVPVVHFVGEFTCPEGACLDQDRLHSTSSPDFTVNYLPGFGHLDVYYGTHSEEKVKKPMLDWMNAHL